MSWPDNERDSNHWKTWPGNRAGPPEQRLSFMCWRDRTGGECAAMLSLNSSFFGGVFFIFPLGGVWIQNDSRPSVSLSVQMYVCRSSITLYLALRLNLAITVTSERQDINPWCENGTIFCKVGLSLEATSKYNFKKSSKVPFLSNYLLWYFFIIQPEPSKNE